MVRILLNSIIFLILCIPLSLSAGVEIVSSSQSELVLRYEAEFTGWKEVTVDNSVTLQPEFKAASVPSSNPLTLPVYRDIINVPGDGNYRIVSVDMRYGESRTGFLAPTPRFLDGHYGRKIDFEQFTGKTHGGEARLVYRGISRDRHIAQLEIDLVRFSADAKRIELLKSAEIRISFEPKTTTTSNPANRAENVFSSGLNPDKFIISDFNNSSRNSKSRIPTIQESPATNWLKIEIPTTGVYRITGSQLSDMGHDISAALVNTIKVYGNGGSPLSETVSDSPMNFPSEQAIIVNKQPDGKVASIIFYAQGPKGFTYDGKDWKRYNNYYSNNSYYLLAWGGSEGKRAAETELSDSQADFSPYYYTERICIEEDIANPYPSGSGRIWFGRSYFDAPIVTKLNNLYRQDAIKYKFSLAHKASSKSIEEPPAHGYFTVSDNNKTLLDKVRVSELSDSEYDYANRIRPEAELIASEIPSDNRSVIRIEYDNPSAKQSALPYLDYIEIHYPREFVAVENSIDFDYAPTEASIGEFTINNFNGSIYGFEVSDQRNPILIHNEAVTGGVFKFKAVFQKDDNSNSIRPRQFFISSSPKSCKLLEIDYAGLRHASAEADLIVITHVDLLGSAQKYADYRAMTNNLKATVVTTAQIFNEFGAGMEDLTAIRDYINYAMVNWQNKPKYVTLWGDGHYDFRNISTNKKNYVPAYQVPDENISTFQEKSASFSTDDFFVNVVGDDNLPDLAIGRVIADSPEKAEWMVEKIKHYDNSSAVNSWLTRLIMVADDALTSRGSDRDTHVNQSETLVSDYVPDAIERQKIYLPEYETVEESAGRRKPKVNQEIINAVNTNGGILLNFIGHGNPRVWTHEAVLVREIDIPKMTNLDMLFFLTAATCDYGRFDATEVQSGAEEMFMSSTGGSIGILSATRVVYSHENAALNNAFYKIIFRKNEDTGRYPTMGEAMLQLKQQNFDINDRKYFLMGDPLLKVKIPEYIVVIDSVDGIATSSLEEPIHLKALSHTSISGRILDPLGESLAADFNGQAVITVRDGDQNIEVNEEVLQRNVKYEFTKHGGLLSRATYKVEAGRFSGEFIIPKDISFSDETGNIFGLAFSEDNKYAKGIFTNFVIDGILAGVGADSEGPDIKIFLDSREFISGDIVRKSPQMIIDLFDETGINSAGLGIGHDIEAWLDDNPMPIKLTGKFAPSVEDPRYGTATDFLYNLAPGEHTLRVRAWDVYNNYSVESVKFSVTESGQVHIGDVDAYPNPFEEETTIEFVHNLEPPFSAELKIYSVEGSLVKILRQNVATPYMASFKWDGTDRQSHRVAAGAYLYTIWLDSGDESRAVKSGTLSIKIK